MLGLGQMGGFSHRKIGLELSWGAFGLCLPVFTWLGVWGEALLPLDSRSWGGAGSAGLGLGGSLLESPPPSQMASLMVPKNEQHVYPSGGPTAKL